MITVCLFFWVDPKSRTAHVYQYNKTHVSSLVAQVKKHLPLPHECVCVTNDPGDFPVRKVALNPRTHLPGTRFAKLQIFAPEAKHEIGERILYMDLDTVIVDSIAPLVERSEDLVLWRNPNFGIPRRAFYNTSMMLLRAGTRTEFWDEFDPVRTPPMLRGLWGGTDQAWVSHRSRSQEEAFWDDSHGVYGAGRIGDKDPSKATELPENARIVFFPGRREPSMKSVQDRHPWIREHRL